MGKRVRRLPVARGGEPAAPLHGAGRPVGLPGRPAGPPLDRPLRDCRRLAAARGPTHGPPLLAVIPSLTISWAGEKNWFFPHRTWLERQSNSCAPPARRERLSAPRCHGPRGGISGTGWPMSGTGWAHDVAGVVPLGHAADALSSSGYPELFCRDGVIAVRCGRRT